MMCQTTTSGAESISRWNIFEYVQFPLSLLSRTYEPGDNLAARARDTTIVWVCVLLSIYVELKDKSHEKRFANALSRELGPFFISISWKLSRITFAILFGRCWETLESDTEWEGTWNRHNKKISQAHFSRLLLVFYLSRRSWLSLWSHSEKAEESFARAQQYQLLKISLEGFQLSALCALGITSSDSWVVELRW